MTNILSKSLILFSLFFSSVLQAEEKISVLANLDLLNKAKIPVITEDSKNKVGFAEINSWQQGLLQYYSHQNRTCAGYEALEPTYLNHRSAILIRKIKSELEQLSQLVQKQEQYANQSYLRFTSVQENPEITVALQQLQAMNIHDFVRWLSSYETRYARQSDPNQHVQVMFDKLKQLSEQSKLETQIELIEHKAVKQRSIVFRIIGSERPDEVLVFGAHFDSISGWMGNGKAPGADDNASGSGTIFETLRVLLGQVQPKRTLEFYWYAGEELGLLGSSEIAKAAKASNKKIIAVMNLDMTMYPGSGENNIVLMTDFTSSWLNELAQDLNRTYVKANISLDQCGYGCSDHASWFRNGFPAMMPSEAKMRSITPNIHTERDVIANQLSFNHALIFAKLALSMAMELGNSIAVQPY